MSSSATSSSRDLFGYLSPPPNYQHSPPSASANASFSSFQLAPLSQSSTRSSSNLAASSQNNSASLAAPALQQTRDQDQQQDEHYLSKYRDMKQRVEQLELDNDRLHLKCLVVRKNIQRLRLERAILYERLRAMNADPVASSNDPLQHVATGHDSNPSQLHGREQLSSRSQHQSTSTMNPSSRIASSLTSPSGSVVSSFKPPPPHVPNKRSLTTTPLLPSSSQKHNDVSTIAESAPPVASLTLHNNHHHHHHQVRNGNFMKTFSFVHEYSSSSSSSATQKSQRQSSTFIHHSNSECPVEIKFHQYEAGISDQQRTRRDGDNEKGGKQKRRAFQDPNNRAQRSSLKRNAPAFRDNQLTYSFHVEPIPPENISPTQPEVTR